MGVEITHARADQIPAVRELLREYRASVDADICFASYEQELAALPDGYFCILLAQVDQQLAGCVGLRQLDANTCEMKRLFIRPFHQRQGLGRKLIIVALDEATGRGHQRMVLDTLPTMLEAIALYRAMGFTLIPRYNDNPDPGTLFFEKQLLR